MEHKSTKASQQQLEVYFFLVQYVARNGFQPSQRELAEQFGIKQASMVDRLQGLAKHGLVEFAGGIKRDRAIKLRHVNFSPEFDKVLGDIGSWMRPMLDDC